MPRPPRSFLGTKYCGLCLGPFPSCCLQGPDAWQSEVRAVLCLGSNSEINGDTIALTERVTLPNVRKVVNVPLVGWPHIESVTICRDSYFHEQDQVEQLAFCFHDWCYSVLRWELKECPKSQLYKLVRTLTPIKSLWDKIYIDQYQLGFRMLVANTHHDLYRVEPLSMSKLPEELRSYIWEYVGPISPASAFIIVAGETTRLARSLISSITHDIALKKGLYLSAKTITIFGTEYIRSLAYQDFEVNSKVVGPVTELRFVTSLHGICSVRPVGVGWEMGWLGKIPNTSYPSWYGVMRPVGPTLRISYNGLNCVDISSLDRRLAHEIMWDKPDFPASFVDPNGALFDFNRDIIGASDSIVETPERRFFRYLPLCIDDNYITGLTVYNSGIGIIGLEAHFTQTSRLSGRRDGCALYFPLCPEERITHTWLRIVNSRFIVSAAPALIIQTTLGRTCTFGFYILPSLVAQNNYKWILLEGQGCVTGFYYEVPNDGSVIMRLGITSDDASQTATPLTPQYYYCDFSRIAGPNAGLFLSVALLNGFEKVELCRVGDRCTGILIHYFKRPPAVLGQWYNSGVSQHSCIYSSSWSSVAHICFKMRKSGNYNIVTDVWFSKDGSIGVPEHDCQVFNVGENLVWWFSTFYDAILPWRGRLVDIPEESKLKLQRSDL